MLKTIEKECCQDNFMTHENKLDNFNLVLSADGLVFLKVGNHIIEDARHTDLEAIQRSDFFKENYEYNKMYLNLSASNTGYNFQINCFFKGKEKSLLFSETIDADEYIATEDVVELTRDELEQLLDKENFDSMFLFHRNGPCVYAYDKKLNLELGKRIVPSDDDIVKKDLSNRKHRFNIARSLNRSLDSKENYEESHRVRTIEEIKNCSFYAPSLMGKYSHFILTTFNNQFYLTWFKLEFIEKNKFKLTTYPIEIKSIDLEEILTSASKYIKDFIPDESLYTKENHCGNGVSRVRIIDKKSN